jgi:quinoprotein glucose dehydrogenase
MRYSALTTIDRDNVTQLRIRWTWNTGERRMEKTDSTKSASPGFFEATPVMVGDTLYLSTPYSRVVALDASTGQQFWSYDPGAYRWGPASHIGFVHRGVALWTDGRERRVFIDSRWRLIALDAHTGQPVLTFGQNGEIDLTQGLSRKVNRLQFLETSPPVVYGDLVIVGSSIGDHLAYPNDPPGDVQAFNARTGLRVWGFSPIPWAGQSGNETWEAGAAERTGHANVWAPITLDVPRGLVYLPVSTPSNDWYGGARKGANLFSESIVCLNARTGALVWYYQTAHHGLWDYDLAAPPTLVRITVRGKPIDAVAVPTKSGFLFVFDRVSGKPIWPIEERAVPQSDVPGEQAWPTQPFPTKPLPFATQGFTAADVVDFTPEIHARALQALKGYRWGPLFTPPSLQGTVVMPGWLGGSGWGGGAFDPESGTLYVKASNSPSRARLFKPGAASDTIDAEYVVDAKTALSVAVPTRAGWLGFFSRSQELPINRPPYGTLTAIDLNTGDQRWQVTLGDTPSIRNHPLLKDLHLPPLGVVGPPGGIVTRGGLVFITGGGETLFAIDKTNGTTLWHADLGSASRANPMTYQTRSGDQFVVVATGAGEDARLVAFAIPRP